MRILIVEDERALCDTLAKGLKRKGYEADVCYDGDAALDWLLAEHYDLILLDLNLPGRDGMELLRALRKKYPGIQGIYRHYDVTGKKCPAPLVAKEAWERFLDRVKEEDAEMKLYKHTTQMPDWAAASVRKAIGKGFLTVNSKGEISVYEPNLQVIVMMDRMGLLGE